MTTRSAIGLRLALAASLAATPVASAHASTPVVAQVAVQPAGIPKTAEELDALYAHAQMQVEGYNATGDVAKLRVAHEELNRWLTAHAQLYGYAEAAAKSRAPVQQQIAALDEVLGKSAPAPTPVAATPPPTPGPAMTPEQANRRRTYDKMSTWGIVSLSLGVGTLVLGALPAWALRNRALDNAAEERFYVEEQKYLSRARRRENATYGLLAVGSAVTALGIALIAVGASGRARIRREMSLSLSPSFGPGLTGASATVRF